MKFKTEITTRNWNNGWVDVDLRLPRGDTDCYILWKARIIEYDYDTIKSVHISKVKGMGNALFKGGKWEDITTESRCDDCWNQHTRNLYDEYFTSALANRSEVYGLDTDNKQQIVVASPYSVIDEDIFVSIPYKASILWRYYYQEKKGSPKYKHMYSCDFEILSWCSVPDKPINPFEEENNDE